MVMVKDWVMSLSAEVYMLGAASPNPDQKPACLLVKIGWQPDVLVPHQIISNRLKSIFFEFLWIKIIDMISGNIIKSSLTHDICEFQCQEAAPAPSLVMSLCPRALDFDCVVRVDEWGCMMGVIYIYDHIYIYIYTNLSLEASLQLSIQTHIWMISLAWNLHLHWIS